jgi:hypothetical protein
MPAMWCHQDSHSMIAIPLPCVEAPIELDKRSM